MGSVAGKVNPRDRVLSVPVDRGDPEAMLAAIVERSRSGVPGTVCFANVHTLHRARRDPSLLSALESSFLVAPDGMPLSWLLSWTGRQQRRFDGMSAFPALLAEAADEGHSVALFGDTPEVLAAVREKARRELPALRIVEAISPRVGALPFPDAADHARRLAASGAAMVFVALGCPKQEIWMADHADSIPAVLLGVGNALRVWVGLERRAPVWMRRIGLEWCVRLWQNPSRLWMRYLVSNAWFLVAAPVWLVARRFRRVARRPFRSRRGFLIRIL